MKGSYKGKRCFVIAGGPSTKTQDFSKLKNEITICVNESYKLLPFEPTFICLGDYKLWPLVKEKYARMSSSIIVGEGLNGTAGSEYSGNNLVIKLPLNRDKQIQRDGFDFLFNELRVGWNVIPEVVLPFVCWAGFSDCVLLGCDCNDDGYGYEAQRKSNQRFDPRAMESYKVISESKLPTKIWNATPRSGLKYFPAVNYKKIKTLKVVGFYTPDRNYKELAERMKISVLAQGLDCEIFERKSWAKPDMTPPMGWVINCSQCGFFIQDMINKFPEHDLLYLDADAIMIRPPEVFLGMGRMAFDFAVPFINCKYVKNQLSSNTIYFANNDKSKLLLHEWTKEQAKRNKAMLEGDFKKAYKEVWDQKVLQDVLPRVPGLKWAELPLTYAKISITPKGEELLPQVDPSKVVISQFQASRRNKMEVGGENGNN